MRSAPAGQPEGMVPLSVVHNGDYRISSQLDVDALAGIRVITGNVRVESPFFEVLSLPDLEVVGGNFFIYDFNDALTQISMPKLETIGGSTQWTAQRAELVGLPKLDSVGQDLHFSVRTASSVPCLRTVPGYLSVLGTPELVSITFDRLEEVLNLRVWDNAQLTALSMPALTSAANFEVLRNAKLASIDVSAMVQGDAIRLEDNPLLAQLGFENLTTARYINLVNIADVTGFPKLQSLSQSLLVRGTSATTLATFATLTSAISLIISNNAQLTNLGVTSLTTLTGYMGFYGAITNNPMLPTCQAVALSNHVMRPFEISGNNDAATCP